MFEGFDINFIIFGVMPYVALTVFLVGSIARYERDPFTWKSSSSQLLRRKQLIWGSILFHVGILTVFFGHLVGLSGPWDGVSSRRARESCGALPIFGLCVIAGGNL